MRKLDFLTVFIPFTDHKHDHVTPQSRIATLDADQLMYDWNAATQRWQKMHDDDPEPPDDLDPGIFDGQILELPKL